jgi:hypothetical protein
VKIMRDMKDRIGMVGRMVEKHAGFAAVLCAILNDIGL